MRWIVSLVVLVCISCATSSEERSNPTGRELVRGLTREIAHRRSSILRDLHYDLFFNLPVQKENSEFTGSVNIHFEVVRQGEAVTLDFTGGKVLSLEVNGKAMLDSGYNGFFLTLPARFLKLGENTVSINFSHPFSSGEGGLYRYVDPADNRQYLYTDFEPYHANSLFPCFDQPDLKATFTLKVEAPSEWSVISSNEEISSQVTKPTRREWLFPKSRRFSTYVFSLHAGEYKVWNARAGEIPLRLFARRSLAQYIHPNDWFEVTRQGLDFFEKYFNYPYPFQKYDQVIVPDFNHGAMENVGAVTFSERFVHRGAKTNDELERQSYVILHELSHMWFGNLVTMEWWSGLWLNESFATYLANLALSEGTQFKAAWQTFLSKSKLPAIFEDQQPTTHSIESYVHSTDEAFSNFDSITYGKGASALRQLSFFIGEESFRDGVRDYIKKYAYQNTDLKHFFDTLQNFSDKDLSKWSEEWLRTTGVNTAEVKLECIDDRIQNFAIRLRAQEDGNIIRSHLLDVVLFDFQEGKFVQRSTESVLLSEGEKVLSQLRGEACPYLVLMNTRDHDYVRTRIDDRSVAHLREHFQKLEDPLTRLVVWSSLWEMVRDGQFGILEFSDLAFRSLPLEENTKILNYVGERIYGGDVSVVKYLPRRGKIARGFAKQYEEVLEEYFWKHLLRAKSGTDIQKFWFDGYVRVAHTQDAMMRLRKILRRQTSFPGLKIDQDRRWRIILQMTSMNAKGAKYYRQSEGRSDRSENGIKGNLAAEVAVPYFTTKQEWLKSLRSQKSDFSLAREKVVIENLFPYGQEDLESTFALEIFKGLKQVSGERSNEFLSSYSQYLTPRVCTKQNADMISDFVRSHPSIAASVSKNLKIHANEEYRCAAIRELAASSIKEKIAHCWFPSADCW